MLKLEVPRVPLPKLELLVAEELEMDLPRASEVKSTLLLDEFMLFLNSGLLFCCFAIFLVDGSYVSTLTILGLESLF